MKKIMVLIAFGILIGILPAHAQDTIASSSSTTVTTTYPSQANDDMAKPSNITGIALGVVGVLALGLVIVVMVRGRKNTVGGIQNQAKTEPRPRTPESINNPGSGV